MDVQAMDGTGAGPRSGWRLGLPMAAGAGLLWNLYGLWQFLGSFRQTAESLVAGGRTAAQAEVYLSLPAWVTLAFAIGVVGGAAGTALLLARRAAAVPVLAVSLVGYVVLFAGDLAYGVFAGAPVQLAIISTVVVIAAALSALSLFARKRGMLR